MTGCVELQTGGVDMREQAPAAAPEFGESVAILPGDYRIRRSLSHRVQPPIGHVLVSVREEWSAMPGIEGITARITHLQTHITSLAASTAPSPLPTAAGKSGTSFASFLNHAMSAGTPAVTGSDKLNANGVPAGLAAYGNGKVPDHALSKVGNTRHQLWAPAANALEGLITAAKRDGVKIGITDSYRPYAEQVDLVRRKGLYSQGGLAAKPGTSDHGWGMAADLDLDAKAQAWMRANGPNFGFHEDTPREPWHWGFKPTS
jgi:LAS superfamily LD-carboxypeptidase LdcB